MSDENKENNFISCTPINLRTISNHKTLSSKRFTPYKTPKSQRFARILTNGPREFGSQSFLKDPGLNITNLTPPDSPERVELSSKRTPLISTRIASELTSINKDISYVVGKTWRIHQCSPLFNFETSSLESYKESLKAHLQTVINCRSFDFQVGDDEYGGNCQFAVDFSTLEDFSLYDSDEKAIKVAVYERGKESKVSSFTADIIFCNFGGDSQDFCPKDDFTHLPVCLVKGPVGLTRSVLSWFQSQFDCIITSLKLPPLELGWLCSLWAGVHSQKEAASSFELFYAIPSRAEGLKKLVLSFDSGDVKSLWDCCHSNESNIFTGEQAELFMAAINAYFYNHFKVRLDSLSLSRICTSIVYLSREGQLKILHDKYVRHVLQQITESVLEIQRNGRL